MNAEKVEKTIEQVAVTANSMIYVHLFLQVLVKSKMLLLLDFFFLFQYIIHLDTYDINYPALIDLTFKELRFLIEFQMLKLNQLLKLFFPDSVDDYKKGDLIPDFLASSIIASVLFILLMIVLKLVQMFKAECKDKLQKVLEK